MKNITSLKYKVVYDKICMKGRNAEFTFQVSQSNNTQCPPQVWRQPVIFLYLLL